MSEKLISDLVKQPKFKKKEANISQQDDSIEADVIAGEDIMMGAGALKGAKNMYQNRGNILKKIVKYGKKSPVTAIGTLPIMLGMELNDYIQSVGIEQFITDMNTKGN